MYNHNTKNLKKSRWSPLPKVARQVPYARTVSYFLRGEISGQWTEKGDNLSQGETARPRLPLAPSLEGKHLNGPDIKHPHEPFGATVCRTETRKRIKWQIVFYEFYLAVLRGADHCLDARARTSFAICAHRVPRERPGHPDTARARPGVCGVT